MNETNGAGARRLAVYAINEKDGGGTWWQRIGSAYQNRDGSMNLYLDALPLGTSKLQVREPKDEPRPAPQNGARRAAGGEVTP